MNPNVTHSEYQGRKVFTVVTDAGAVHLVADEVHEHLADAYRAISGEPNPVVAELEQQAADAAKE